MSIWIHFLSVLGSPLFICLLKISQSLIMSVQKTKWPIKSPVCLFQIHNWSLALWLNIQCLHCRPSQNVVSTPRGAMMTKQASDAYCGSALFQIQRLFLQQGQQGKNDVDFGMQKNKRGEKFLEPSHAITWRQKMSWCPWERYLASSFQFSSSSSSEQVPWPWSART